MCRMTNEELLVYGGIEICAAGDYHRDGNMRKKRELFMELCGYYLNVGCQFLSK